MWKLPKIRLLGVNSLEETGADVARGKIMQGNNFTVHVKKKF